MCRSIAYQEGAKRLGGFWQFFLLRWKIYYSFLLFEYSESLPLFIYLFIFIKSVGVTSVNTESSPLLMVIVY